VPAACPPSELAGSARQTESLIQGHDMKYIFYGGAALLAVVLVIFFAADWHPMSKEAQALSDRVDVAERVCLSSEQSSESAGVTTQFDLAKKALQGSADIVKAKQIIRGAIGLSESGTITENDHIRTCMQQILQPLLGDGHDK
jgi:hypothetical protein